VSLIIPPLKSVVLVMEGSVTRVTMLGRGSVLSGGGGGEDEQEGFLHVGGEVWVERVEGGGERRKLG